MLVNVYAISGSIYKKQVVAVGASLGLPETAEEGDLLSTVSLFFYLFEFYTMIDTHYYLKINE